jgi:hypothetical protein
LLLVGFSCRYFSKVFAGAGRILPGRLVKDGDKGHDSFSLFIRVILTQNPKSFPRTVRAIFERFRGEN